MKFTSEGSVRVHASARTDSDGAEQIHMAIRDTGIGIAPEKQGHLFQTFSQLDPSHTREYGGTGLGLAISRQLVELQGGEIGVQSMQGEGSTFWFTLPITRPSTETMPPVAPPIEGSPLSPERAHTSILLVEDNQVNCLVARGMLRHLGCKAEMVHDGQAALDYLNSHSVDLVFMDIQMPIMDGLEATRHQRKREQETGGHVPIVAMTAHAMTGDKEIGLAAGMDDYITKPIRRTDLERILRQFLDEKDVKNT